MFGWLNRKKNGIVFGKETGQVVKLPNGQYAAEVLAKGEKYYVWDDGHSLTEHPFKYSYTRFETVHDAYVALQSYLREFEPVEIKDLDN